MGPGCKFTMVNRRLGNHSQSHSSPGNVILTQTRAFLGRYCCCPQRYVGFADCKTTRNDRLDLEASRSNLTAMENWLCFHYLNVSANWSAGQYHSKQHKGSLPGNPLAIKRGGSSPGGLCATFVNLCFPSLT